MGKHASPESNEIRLPPASCSKRNRPTNILLAHDDRKPIHNAMPFLFVRSGTYPARIYSLSFNIQSTLLAVSSDSDTVHIFKLDERAREYVFLIA